MNLELLGKKLGMSQVYDEDNNLVPVTIIEAGPCPVLQVKTSDKEGYTAVQIGYNPKGSSPNKANRCSAGHAKKAGVEAQQVSREFRLKDDHDYEQGTVLTVENLKETPMVDVVSTTKGKGFQGVVKRWNFLEVPHHTDPCFIDEEVFRFTPVARRVFRIRRCQAYRQCESHYSEP